MEKLNARIFRRRSAAAAENLSGMRSARGNQRNALPRVRREHAILSCSTEQEILRTLRRARNPGHFGDAGGQHSNVGRQSSVDDASGRSRRSAYFVRNELGSILPVGSQSSIRYFL